MFESEAASTRADVAAALDDAAAEIEAGEVAFAGEEGHVSIPETPRFEVEREPLTDSETGEERDELEYESRWTR